MSRLNTSLLHLASWLVSDLSSRHDVQSSEPISSSSWAIQTFGLPSYSLNVTAAVIRALKSRPSIQTDFHHGLIRLKPGQFVSFGDDIGFVNPNCHRGFWPAGSYCPRRILQRYAFPLIPVADTSNRPIVSPGEVVGTLVNGVPLLSFLEPSSYKDLLTWVELTAEHSKYSLDVCGGHAHSDRLYHHHHFPLCLQQRLEDVSGDQHSPIYGWARDGFPIHGPHQGHHHLAKACWFKRDYSSQLTGCADGRRSCILSDNTNIDAGTYPLPEVLHGPSFDEVILTSSSVQTYAKVGLYFQDYYFNRSCSLQGGPYLNQFNGHDHDGLGFHYHFTIDENGDPAFPYAMGPNFYGIVPAPVSPLARITKVTGSLLAILLIFYAASIVCDEYLIPCVEWCIVRFNMPEELAAVTIVSLGNAAPELVLDMLGAIKSTPSLSIPTTLGTAMTAFGLIPPLCVFSCSSRQFVISAFPLLREVVFYVIGLLIFTFAIFDGYIQTIESLVLASLYAIYVFVVICFYCNTPRPTVPDIETEQLTSSHDDAHPSEAPSLTEISLAEGSSEQGVLCSLKFVLRLILLPVGYLIHAIMPRAPNGTSKTRSRPIFVMLLSILIMGCLSYSIISICEVIIEELAIDPSTIGATLIAIGAEIPDILSAVALARRGYFDGAMASAVGSQVVNISLGVGLPSLMVCLFGKGVVMIHGNVTSIRLLTKVVLVVICSYSMAIFPLYRFCTCSLFSSNTLVYNLSFNQSLKTHISRLGASLLLIIYVSMYTLFVFENEDGD